MIECIKRTTLILTILFFALHIQSQNEYWQQKVDYTINVKLDDISNALEGDIRMLYHNNSTNDLNFIYIHLWPNAYYGDQTELSDELIKNGNTDLYYAEADKTGFIDMIDFTANGSKLKWEYESKSKNIAKVYFNSPLPIGDSIAISTPFYVKIPSSEFSRLGHSQQSYQITQWYPKPAVYDKEGWHQMPYINQGEFYSEYGSYNVYITLPENYRIWGTGELVNGNQENKWLDSLSKITKTKNTFTEDLNFPQSSTKSKTLHFYQNNVHDFAWFADKRYHVLRDYIVLKTGDSILIQSMFTNQEAELWTKSLKYIGQATKFYSNMVGNYPYKTVTAVQGALNAGAGMEYPNITIIGISKEDINLEETIMHEVGHNWFYGIFGFNERKYPWMDEGINTFYQSLYMKKYYPRMSLSKKYFSNDISIFGLDKMNLLDEYYWELRFIASYNLDQSANLSADKYTPTNYGLTVYGKVALVFNYLRSYLGEGSFDSIMQEFFEEWKYKHPQPTDFINFFESKSKQDLSWFFDDILKSKDRIDYKIINAKETGDSLVIKIKNKGEINSPVLITAKNSYGDIIESKWIDGFVGSSYTSLLSKDYSKIEINNSNYMLDYNPGNNYYYKNKIFHKRKIPKLKLIIDIPKAEESVIYFSPLIGWNNYNKFMFGAILTNHSLLEKKYEYEIMPLYSFKTKNINGSFAFRRNFYTHSYIRRLSIGLSGKKYNYYSNIYEYSYQRLVPAITLYFKNTDGETRINHKLILRTVIVAKEIEDYKQENGNYVPSKSTQYYTLYNLKYLYENKRIMVPFSLQYNLEFNKELAKMDFRTDFSINYFKPKKYLDIGIFAGYIFKYPTNPQVDYSYKMSSWNGRDDYLYDYTYLGRSETSGLLGAQMTQRDGGFYIPSALGRSWGAIAAVNLRSSIPFTNLIKIYFNMGIESNPKSLRYLNSNKPLYEGGVILSIINSKFEVYIPLLTDEITNNYYALNSITFSEKIRFTLRLDLADPFKLLKELHL